MNDKEIELNNRLASAIKRIETLENKLGKTDKDNKELFQMLDQFIDSGYMPKFLSTQYNEKLKELKK
tara:strand:+ start:6470 stop:6670 length:201 start_codon:yes stop_codon:yes gene_type:complete